MSAVRVGDRIALVDPDSGDTVGGVVVDARGPEWPAELDPRPGGYVGDARGDWFGIAYDDCPGHVEPVNESDFEVAS